MDQKDGFKKKDAQKIFTDIGSLTTEQRNELRVMMVKADFGEEEDEDKKDEDF